jgi:glycosyltransferase involved in cell wall biosynthesis
LQQRVLTYPDGVGQRVYDWDGVEVSRNLPARPTSQELEAKLKEFQPDLVHLQSSSFLHTSSMNRALSVGCAVPLVTTVHDTPHSWRVFYTIPSLRSIYRTSSRLVTHSSRVSRVLQEFHRVDASKIVRMPLGVDTDAYRPDVDATEARARYGLDGKRVVLFFGFLRPGKGIETLLKAWVTVASSLPDALLVIGGGSPTRARRYGFARSEVAHPARLKTMASNLGIRDRVRFTGYVPDALVPGLLASAEMVVFPYEGSPSSSYPLQKTLSAGKPIIATAFPGFREVLTEGREAVLIPPGDAGSLAGAIQNLLADPVAAREMGRLAREKAVRFLDWSVVIRETMGVYTSLRES